MPEGVTQLDLTGAVDPELEQLRAERLAQLQQSGGKFVQIVGGGAAVSAEEEDDGDDEVCAHECAHSFMFDVGTDCSTDECPARGDSHGVHVICTPLYFCSGPCSTPSAAHATPHRIHIVLHHITSPPRMTFEKATRERVS
jgi:hypothetical protein